MESITDQETSWIEQVISKQDSDSENDEASSKLQAISSPPAEFFKNQPVPKNGIICYFVVFSDYNY